jgi:hypothetical protein
MLKLGRTARQPCLCLHPLAPHECNRSECLAECGRWHPAISGSTRRQAATRPLRRALPGQVPNSTRNCLPCRGFPGSTTIGCSSPSATFPQPMSMPTTILDSWSRPRQSDARQPPTGLHERRAALPGGRSVRHHEE